jgi:hypothetical protein
MLHADDRIKATPIAYGETSMERATRILVTRAHRAVLESRLALLALHHAARLAEPRRDLAD